MGWVREARLDLGRPMKRLGVLCGGDFGGICHTDG